MMRWGSGKTQQGSIADLPKLRPCRVNFDIHTNYRGLQRKTMCVPFPFATHFFLGAISGQVLGSSILHSRVRCALSLSSATMAFLLNKTNILSHLRSHPQVPLLFLYPQLSTDACISRYTARIHGYLSFGFWRFYLIVCFAIAFYYLPSFLSLSIDFD